jgi:hypothetical protein
MNGKVIKVIGFVATVVGLGASLVTDWVNDKKLDDKINTKVSEALAEMNSKIES